MYKIYRVIENICQIRLNLDNVNQFYLFEIKTWH